MQLTDKLDFVGEKIMRKYDVEFIKQIKNREDLCDYLSCECGVDFIQEDILCDDLKSLLEGSECNYDMEPFACDGSGGVFVLLNQSSIGYLDSEGQAGIIANNLKDFFSIILNCGYVNDWAKFGWLADANTFIKAYNNLEIQRDKVCVKLFVEENELVCEPIKIYNIFKEAVSTQPQLMIKAVSADYADYEQLFDLQN